MHYCGAGVKGVCCMQLDGRKQDPIGAGKAAAVIDFCCHTRAK